MDAYDFICALKAKKSANSGWNKIVSALIRLKVADKLLDELHVGIKNLTNTEIKKLVKSW